MDISRLVPDKFTLALLATVVTASLLPADGRIALALSFVTTGAVALLFFLHGAKLSREAIVGGITHWRLHLLIFASTFVMFPLIGIALKPLLVHIVTPELYVGVLYLCVLPATVQSAIAFTSMAGGNVPGAVCSASASTVLGVFITPLLVNMIVLPSADAASSFDAIGRIVLQLVVPFVAGHLLRPWIGKFVHRHKQVLSLVDRGSILLVVYGAFSAAVISGLWKQIPALAIVGLLFACALVLAIALTVTTLVARWMGFDRADQITVVFCGSKKSLASGIPMAQLLFAPSAVGAVVLPVMLFHQMQLIVCSVLAQRYARQAAESESEATIEATVASNGHAPRVG
ncbi:bile acid:sodium symporter [soil metagenome]